MAGLIRCALTFADAKNWSLFPRSYTYVKPSQMNEYSSGGGKRGASRVESAHKPNRRTKGSQNEEWNRIARTRAHTRKDRKILFSTLIYACNLIRVISYRCTVRSAISQIGNEKNIASNNPERHFSSSKPSMIGIKTRPRIMILLTFRTISRKSFFAVYTPTSALCGCDK